MKARCQVRKNRPATGAVLLLLVLSAAVVPAGPGILSAQEEVGQDEIAVLRWGGVSLGWHDMYELVHVVEAPGALGRLDLVLQDLGGVKPPGTELLLSFDLCSRNRAEGSFSFLVGNMNIFPSREVRRLGSCSAGFLNLQNRVEIQPTERSLFFDDPLGSFAIDFHLRPVQVNDSTVVLDWRTPTVDTNGDFTGIQVSFRERRMVWRFDNIFTTPEGRAVPVVLEERVDTPVNEWHHHGLVYDGQTGLLVLYHDGRAANLRWLTVTGAEGGTLLRGSVTPYLTVPMVLGRSYSGYMDGFRIGRGEPGLQAESGLSPGFLQGTFHASGTAVSDVLDLENRGTELVMVDWEGEEEGGSAIRVYVRMAPVWFEPDDTRLQWQLIPRGGNLQSFGLKGRYLQWKTELYSPAAGDDGPELHRAAGTVTPVLHSLSLFVEPDPPPEPPIFLEARPLHRGVLLRWVTNRERDIAGYKVYYGTSPGTYFGRSAEQGDSPIFVPAGHIETGSIGEAGTLILPVTNLKNEQVYYFSVTAVDADGQEGGFSVERVARPSTVHLMD